ncbi:hypothetical protein GR160_02885 [Flavobacterium sp. Sd200]|uniref:hypothetical protein n=1 Tax=Flavobacterium sp. Sd200 TaxID=2692211 RepID=UPI001367C968|nr:hypothetical protein [Flavobacterium sp. Sd200]MXN90159.1 hypothetical protein [Flavobacterium sp. Sd200]
MQRSGLTTIKYTRSSSLIKLNDITSLTIANYGEFEVTAFVNDVARKIPGFNPAIGVPYGSYNLPGDGTYCDVNIRIEIKGAGEVIIDYRKLIPQTC